MTKAQKLKCFFGHHKYQKGYWVRHCTVCDVIELDKGKLDNGCTLWRPIIDSDFDILQTISHSYNWIRNFNTTFHKLRRIDGNILKTIGVELNLRINVK